MSLNHGVNELPDNPVISVIHKKQQAIQLSRTLFLKHRLQFGLVNIFVVADLVLVRLHRHVGGQKEDVIN